MNRRTEENWAFFFNSLISRRLKRHHQAAQYTPIPSWFIPEYRGGKKSETRNNIHVYVVSATFRISH